MGEGVFVLILCITFPIGSPVGRHISYIMQSHTKVGFREHVQGCISLPKMVWHGSKVNLRIDPTQVTGRFLSLALHSTCNRNATQKHIQLHYQMGNIGSAGACHF